MAVAQDKRTSSKQKARLIAYVFVALFALSLPAAFWLRSGLSSPGASSAENQSEQQAQASDRNEVVLACPGRVEGLTDVIDVGAGIDGVLAAVLVEEGQQVKAGEVIALITCDDLKAELEAARAMAESARQSRQRLLRGSKEEERRIAADEAAAAEAVLRQAQLHHQRMARLYEKGDVSKEALERARRDLEVAEAALRASVSRKELVNASPLPEELARADAEVRAADERVSTAIAKLDKCSIKAPITGTILRRHLKAGEPVSVLVPRPIVSLADISQLRVRAEVDERDLGRIHLGQQVVVLADAFPGRRFAGRVSRPGAQMGRKKVRTGDPAEKSDRDVLEVLVDLEEIDERLVVGLRTTVQFLAK
jgi:multidrug resistance efflux pump